MHSIGHVALRLGLPPPAAGRGAPYPLVPPTAMKQGGERASIRQLAALLGRQPQTQGVQADEASGVRLLVGAAIVLEGGDFRVVEAVGGAAA